MRHINFDESLVLREFARIAGEKGMVKEAAGDPVSSLMQAARQSTPTGPAKTVWDGFVQELSQLNRGADPAELKSYLLGRWKDPKMQQLINQHLGTPAPAARANWPSRLADAAEKAARGPQGVVYSALAKELRSLKPDISPVELKQYLQMRGWMKTPGLSDMLAQVLGPSATKQSSTQEENVKMAEDKLYDVTDETGEQLVEKAHPGGGTRTELTHSKTEENLVETIVEQQQKDIEVATKMPKGTYATLLNLADRLDKMGYVKAADRVDTLLKKKIAQDPFKEAAQRERARILQRLQSAPAEGAMAEQRKQMMIREFQGRNTPTLTETVNYAQEFANRWGRMFPSVAPLADYYARNFEEGVKMEQQSLREQYQQRQQQTPTEPQGVAQTEPTKPDARKQRLNRLQNRLRTMVGLKAKENQPFDRQLANVLRTKYPAAWKAVKDRSGFKAIFEAIQGQGKAKMEETAPAAPAAPAAPGGAAAPEVVEEQAINRMYGAAMRGLRQRGYSAEDLEGMGNSIMQTIREEMDSGKRFFNPGTRKGLGNIWKGVNRRLNIDFPRR